jgi:hypothetical protein
MYLMLLMWKWFFYSEVLLIKYLPVPSDSKNCSTL